MADRLRCRHLLLLPPTPSPLHTPSPLLCSALPPQVADRVRYRQQLSAMLSAVLRGEVATHDVSSKSCVCACVCA